MKPVVIIIESGEKIELSRDELKRYIAEAYEQGYSDGKASSTYLPGYIYNSNTPRDVYPDKITVTRGGTGKSVL